MIALPKNACNSLLQLTSINLLLRQKGKYRLFIPLASDIIFFISSFSNGLNIRSRFYVRVFMAERVSKRTAHAIKHIHVQASLRYKAVQRPLRMFACVRCRKSWWFRVYPNLRKFSSQLYSRLFQYL